MDVSSCFEIWKNLKFKANLKSFSFSLNFRVYLKFAYDKRRNSLNLSLPRSGSRNEDVRKPIFFRLWPDQGLKPIFKTAPGWEVLRINTAWCNEPWHSQSLRGHTVTLKMEKLITVLNTKTSEIQVGPTHLAEAPSPQFYNLLLFILLLPPGFLFWQPKKFMDTQPFRFF